MRAQGQASLDMRRSTAELALMWGSYAAMVLCNGLFETLRLGGTTSNQVANEVFVWFMPEGFTFAIWGLIYVMLAVWLVRYTLAEPGLDAGAGLGDVSVVGKLFAASCVLNVAWLVLFHFRMVSVAMLTIIGLWGLVMALYRTIQDSTDKLVDVVPLSLYVAWLTAAAVCNVTCLITRFFDGGIAILSGPSTVLIAAGVLILGWVMGRRFNDVVFPAVMVWTVVGVGVHVMPVSVWTAVVVLALAVFFTAAVVIYIVVRQPLPGIR